MITPPGHDSPSRIHLKKILVVEDSVLLQMLYKLVLGRYRDAGTEILVVGDGRQGLDTLFANPDTELIILDIKMPVIGGLEFLRLVKREPRFSHIPVIIASSEGKEHDTRAGLDAGAAGYVIKPFNPDDLHGMIERVVEGKGHGIASRVVDAVTSKPASGAAAKRPKPDWWSKR